MSLPPPDMSADFVQDPQFRFVEIGIIRQQIAWIDRQGLAIREPRRTLCDSGLVIDGLKAMDRRWNALAARLQLQGKELRVMARLMQIAAVEP